MFPGLLPWEQFCLTRPLVLVEQMDHDFILWGLNTPKTMNQNKIIFYLKLFLPGILSSDAKVTDTETHLCVFW